MLQTNKQTLILLAIAAGLVLIVLVTAIFLLLRRPTTSPSALIPTPTPVPYTRDAEGNYTFTPLQKTIVGKTTDESVRNRTDILNTSQNGNTTIYDIQSATPGEIDEIHTQNGIVIFESVDVFNKATGDYPPKSSTYSREFGEPEKIIEGVSDLGLHISAHIYAKEGFTLFVNRATSTVYKIHRFLPMSTEEYEAEYSEYLQPAPEYPQEFFEE